MLKRLLAGRTATPERRIGREMIARADEARDDRRYRDAAVLYAEALRLRPGNGGIHVQCAHMYKEAGDPAPAEEHYRRALALMPDDADLALQLGHFFKGSGRLEQAAESYRRAAALRHGWNEPAEELARLRRAGARAAADEDSADVRPAPGLAGAADALVHAGDVATVIADLVPRPPAALIHDHRETIELRGIGRRERTHWGIATTLRGIESIRGFCISATPVAEIQLILNGELAYRLAPEGAYLLPNERAGSALRKYPFNIWFDFSAILHGRHTLEIRAIDLRRAAQSRREAVVVAEALREADYPDCDAVVTRNDSAVALEVEIDARASMVRPARRAMLATPPRNVLVQRVDQLGDVVVSVPALRRLREILPDARIVGLLSAANAQLAATLGLFDEMIVVDFPDDPRERRRVMPAAAQEELAGRLKAHRFDLAIDLSENASSRPLLLLSGAPLLFGSPSGEVPSLGIEVAGFTHDRMNGHEIVPHTNKLVGTIEWLGAMLGRHSQVVRRDDLGIATMARFGLVEGERFAVLHDGARLAFTRWPHYPALAALMLDRLDVRIVMMTDDPGLRAALPPALAHSSRFLLLDEQLSFDEFDALLSFCAVFVGNDSGPKHIASLRGAPVVSVHMARNNWNEWGQENSGYIVSRRVPCAGCLIWHDPEECGKGFTCITNIRPDEVLAAVERLL